MPSVVIKIGALLEADLNAMFAPIERRAERMRDAIAKQLSAGVSKGLDGSSGKALHDLLRDAVRDGIRDGFKGASPGGATRVPSVGAGGGPYRGAGAGNASAGRLIGPTDVTARQRWAQQAAEERKTAREEAQAARNLERERARGRRTVDGFARRAVSAGGAAVSGAFGSARGVAREVLGGAGISFDVGGAVRRRVGLQKSAQDVANSGYMEGQAGANGKRVSAGAITRDVSAAGQKYALDNDTVMGGLSAFVGKTGDLDLGRKMLESMSATAKATGADFEDVASAAAAIGNKLGDMMPEEKAKAIERTMLAIAGQGKVGAVEIKDLASQMEKLTSQASKFKTNANMSAMVGSDIGANIATMGVLAQAARKTEKGSAAQATQASMAFVRDLSGRTSMKRFAEKGINAFADKDNTVLKDPQEVIKDILSAAKGNQGTLSYLMPNQNSRAVVNAFMDPYQAAYKSTKGTAKEKDAAGRAAVDKSFAELQRATISQKEQSDSLALALETTEAKTIQFQQRLDRIVGDMADKVIPTFMRLAPTIERVADAFARFIEWAAENPWKAAGAMVAASLGKAVAGAGIEAVLSAGLAKALAGGGVAGAGGLLGGAGKLGAGLGLLTITAASVSLIGDVITQAAAGDRKARADAAVGGDLEAEALAGRVSPEELRKAATEMDARRKAAANNDFSVKHRYGSLLGYFTGSQSTGDLAGQAGEAAAGEAREGEAAKLRATAVAIEYTRGAASGAPSGDAEKELASVESQQRGFTPGSEGAKKLAEAAEILRTAINGTLKVRIVPSAGVDGSGRTAPAAP